MTAKVKEIGPEELAEKLGITVQRLGQLAKAGRIVKLARGKYDLWGSIKSYVQFLREGATANGQAASPEALDVEKLRHERAKADLAEKKLLILNRKVLEVEAVASIWSDMASAVKNKVLGIATAAAPIVADKTTPAECKAVLEEFCTKALADIANMDTAAVAKRGVLAIKLSESVGGEPEEEEEKPQDTKGAV